MTINYELLVMLGSFLVSVGVIYGGIRANDKRHTENIYEIKQMMEKSDAHIDKSIRDLRNEMRSKFEIYNGIKDRVLLTEYEINVIKERIEKQENKEAS